MAWISRILVGRDEIQGNNLVWYKCSVKIALSRETLAFPVKRRR